MSCCAQPFEHNKLQSLDSCDAHTYRICDIIFKILSKKSSLCSLSISFQWSTTYLIPLSHLNTTSLEGPYVLHYECLLLHTSNLPYMKHKRSLSCLGVSRPFQICIVSSYHDQIQTWTNGLRMWFEGGYKDSRNWRPQCKQYAINLNVGPDFEIWVEKFLLSWKYGGLPWCHILLVTCYGLHTYNKLHPSKFKNFGPQHSLPLELFKLSRTLLYLILLLPQYLTWHLLKLLTTSRLVKLSIVYKPCMKARGIQIQ